MEKLSPEKQPELSSPQPADAEAMRSHVLREVRDLMEGVRAYYEIHIVIALQDWLEAGSRSAEIYYREYYAREKISFRDFLLQEYQKYIKPNYLEYEDLERNYYLRSILRYPGAVRGGINAWCNHSYYSCERKITEILIRNKELYLPAHPEPSLRLDLREVFREIVERYSVFCPEAVLTNYCLEKDAASAPKSLLSSYKDSQLHSVMKATYTFLLEQIDAQLLRYLDEYI